MTHRRSLAWMPLVALVAVGCGGAGKAADDDTILDPSADSGGSDFEVGGDFDTGGGPGPSLDSLTIDPANATVFIDTNTGKPGTLTYKAVIGTTDVSGTTTFTLDDPALGTFTGATFNSALTLPGGALGVTTIVNGVADGKAGQAKLTIVKIRKTPDATGKKDFFFTVPYKKDPDPTRDVLKFSTNINKVDVAFVMDTTGSMSGSITNLKSALTTKVIPGLAKIPSVGLAVADHRDFGDSWVVKMLQRMTTDPKLAQTAVNTMIAGGGGDYAEAQLAAMHHVLTGAANGGTIKAYAPLAGTFGAAEFRPGAVPVVVLITDAPWHDASGVATGANVTAEFKKNNVKFVGINVGSKGGIAQANTLSDATSSNLPPGAFGATCAAGKCCTGISGAAIAPDAAGGRCRLNFDAGTGTGVSDSVVTAITAISVGSTYDITAKLSNDPKNAPGTDGKPVDAPVNFIKALRAMSEGDPGNACPPNAAYDSNGDKIDDTFKAVVVGTPVCFEVIPKMNEAVPPLEVAQFFNAFIDVIGMPGNIDLGDRRTVVFLVPPKDPGIK